MPIITLKDYHPEWLKYLPTKEEARLMRRQLVIGANTTHFRLYRGMTQIALAKKAGTTQAIISNLENGDYNPSVDLLGRVAQALQIDEYLLFKEAIDWELLEALNYFITKLTKKPVDILKAMKLMYFTDMSAVSTFGQKLSHLSYIRRNRGPFSKDIYLIDQIFEKDETGEFYVSEPFAKYLLLGEKELKLLDEIIEKYGDFTGKELMKLSYETEPMKGCTVGGDERLGEVVL